MGRRWLGDAPHPPLRGWPAAPGLFFHSRCSYPGEEGEQQSIVATILLPLAPRSFAVGMELQST